VVCRERVGLNAVACRWVSMAAQASKPRKKPNTAVAARKQPLRRGEGRAVHMIHKKPEPELEPAAAGSPPFADIRSPVSVHSPPIQTRHSQAAADEGFGGGPKSGTRPKQPAARRDAEPVPMNEPEPEMSPQVNDHDTDSPKRAKKPFLKRKTKTIKIVPKKNKSDWYENMRLYSAHQLLYGAVLTTVETVPAETLQLTPIL
jgi:hypothetical protein